MTADLTLWIIFLITTDVFVKCFSMLCLWVFNIGSWIPRPGMELEQWEFIRRVIVVINFVFAVIVDCNKYLSSDSSDCRLNPLDRLLDDDRVMFSKSFSPSYVCGFPMLWTEFPSENGDEQIRFCCRYWFHQILELKPPRVNFVTNTNIMFLSLFSMLCLWVFNVGMELPVWEWNWSSGVGLLETQDSLCFYW